MQNKETCRRPCALNRYLKYLRSRSKAFAELEKSRMQGWPKARENGRFPNFPQTFNRSAVVFEASSMSKSNGHQDHNSEIREKVIGEILSKREVLTNNGMRVTFRGK